jgi:hypothetical protein
MIYLLRVSWLVKFRNKILWLNIGPKLDFFDWLMKYGTDILFQKCHSHSQFHVFVSKPGWKSINYLLRSFRRWLINEKLEQSKYAKRASAQTTNSSFPLYQPSSFPSLPLFRIKSLKYKIEQTFRGALFTVQWNALKSWSPNRSIS